jgi:hypothetical protein
VSHWRNKLQKVVNSGFLRPATSNFPDPTVSRPRAYTAETTLLPVRFRRPRDCNYVQIQIPTSL